MLYPLKEWFTSSIHRCCLLVHASLVITFPRLSVATLQCHSHQVEMTDTRSNTKTPFSSTKSRIDSLTNKYRCKPVGLVSPSLLACYSAYWRCPYRRINPVPVMIGETMHVAPSMQPYRFTDCQLPPIRCLSGSWSNEWVWPCSLEITEPLGGFSWKPVAPEWIVYWL